MSPTTVSLFHLTWNNVIYIWQGFINESNHCITFSGSVMFFQILDFANFPLYDSWDNLTWKYFKNYTTILLEAVKVDSVARLVLVTSWPPSETICYTQTICSWSGRTSKSTGGYHEGYFTNQYGETVCNYVSRESLIPIYGVSFNTRITRQRFFQVFNIDFDLSIGAVELRQICPAYPRR